ncbi:hypothetical protein DFH07DRAFT_830917 [Mycena maculata]|uniref:DUF4246 domain-containing protein n=1 Tax=Mycena maculata TaxID=230809 RepID=A0AAD7N6N9_9AGAR|nr:hypothetical protein DFH07DRAFT_830917 [Mycena maculata]
MYARLEERVRMYSDRCNGHQSRPGARLAQALRLPIQARRPSQPGHRKILAIFLVDPTKDPIVSATNIPPQQVEWAAEVFEAACDTPNSILATLPQELRDAVKDRFLEIFTTLKEMEAYRPELNGVCW